MKIVKINKDFLLEGPYIQDATKEIEISDELYNKVKIIPFYHAWKYENDDFNLIEILSPEILQARRQTECFDIIDNRSPMWYNHLTETQKSELETWYQAWLDVTKTKIIPVKPEWLK